MNVVGRLCLLRDDSLNVGDALVENLLESLGVLKLLLDPGDDRLSKLALLPLLDLALVTDPRVEHSLGLCGNGGPLLELKGLSLELGGLLGNLKQGLGDVNDATEVLDTLDALLDGRGVVGAGRVQDARDLLNLLVRIAAPGGPGILGDSPEDGQQRDGDNGLLVDDVELVANGRNAETGTGREDGGLGERTGSRHGHGLQDRLGLLLGVLLGQVRVVAGLGGDGGRECAERKRWADTGGADRAPSKTRGHDCR